MFVGHYAASFALKRLEPRASLGVLFVAVQFADFLFFPLMLLGIERLEIVPGFTDATHFKLVSLSYSHSLLASVCWSIVAYACFRWVVVKHHTVAIVVALAVLSHWFVDLIAHTPDLPLWRDDSMKLGFGLWNHAIAAYIVEAALLTLAAWLYLRSAKGGPKAHRVGMIVFVGFLLFANAVNFFGPAPTQTQASLAISALVSYGIFAGIAFWLDSPPATQG